jgi:hypothetical protein
MLAPQPKDFVRLPDGTPPKLLVFVDTEEDFDWSRPMKRENIHVDSVRELHTIHQIMRDRHVTPHYLVDYPIATDQGAISVLREFRKDGGAVIGSQLHAWVNPPYQEALNPGNTYPGNLDVTIERAKLHALTRAIEDSFSLRPIVYRAGRYGVGHNTPAILEELGYRADVTVRPLFDYGISGGPTFRHLDFRPYTFGETRKLLEIPLSNVFIGPLARFGTDLFSFDDQLKGWHRFANSVLARTRLLRRIALTPEGIPLAEAMRAATQLKQLGAELFCISFHSPSVVPGNTPYVRTAADLLRFNHWMATMLDYLIEEIGAQPATIADVLTDLNID